MERLTLKDFIDRNQNLLTTMAVLVGITTFVGTLSVHWLSNVLSFLSIAGVVTVWVELYKSFPKTGSIRLILFKNILSFSLAGFILYWFLAFGAFWNIFLFVPLFLLLFYMCLTILRQLMSIPFIKNIFGEKGHRNVWQKILLFVYGCVILYGLGWLLSVAIGASPGFNYMLELIRLNFH